MFCPNSAFSTLLRLPLKVATTALLVLAASVCVSNAQEDRSIDLRLFGENVIESYNGCHIAFWQANKNPNKDKYSYVFYAPFNDGEELPGWMKVGKTVYTMHRQDGVQAHGQKLEELRLYRTSKGTFTALIEVNKQHVADNNIMVDKGKMTITRSGHDPFVISVKGGIICPQFEEQTEETGLEGIMMPDNLAGDEIALGRGIGFDNLSRVPRGVLQAVKRDARDCTPENTAGFGAKYAISGAMTLWEIPCNMYARTGSSVFVTALNENTNYASVLTFPAVPDHGDVYDSYEIRNPRVEPGAALFTEEFYDGDGSCGSYAVYQLRAVEGEALEFFLLEYREKPSCDGVQDEARFFPLIYPVQ